MKKLISAIVLVLCFAPARPAAASEVVHIVGGVKAVEPVPLKVQGVPTMCWMLVDANPLLQVIWVGQDESKPCSQTWVGKRVKIDAVLAYDAQQRLQVAGVKIDACR